MIPGAPRAGAAPSPPTPVIMTEEDPAARSRLPQHHGGQPPILDIQVKDFRSEFDLLL